MLVHRISHRKIPYRSYGRSPKSYTNKCLIRHEISKQKAHIPIRKLVERAFDALITMKPCLG